MHVVAVLPEGFCSDCYQFDTMSEARAFMRGVHTGARSYGAGSIYTFVLPGDAQSKGELDDLRENSVGFDLSQGEFDMAWKAIHLKLGTNSSSTSTST